MIPGVRWILPLAGLLSACGSVSNLSLDNGKIQTGQVIGGGTIEVREVRPVAGFLPDPSLLRRGGAGQVDLVYLNPDMQAFANSRIWLQPVTVYTAPGSDLAAVPLQQRQAVANTFTSDLYAAMKPHCRMARRAGADTLRVRFALVDAKVPNAAVNTVATYAPYESAAYGLASFAFNGGVGYFAGTATAESFATDAESGAVVWQAVDKRGGTTSAAEDTLDTWLDVHHAFQAWSKQFVTRLQQLGICKS
nr:DUF3313 domain-containing protein [uncultured Rhodopila sp.]